MERVHGFLMEPTCFDSQTAEASMHADLGYVARGELGMCCRYLKDMLGFILAIGN